MSIDSYSFCPCGSGKKIKFCCSADLAADLGRIVRMFEGEQRLACLAEVDKLISGGKDRAAFLSVKSRLEIELGEPEKALNTAKHFGEKYPDNPLAFCQIAMLQAMDDAELNGVDSLQRSLEICNGKVPSDLLRALEAVAGRLVYEGKYMAARAHLMLLMAFAKDEDQPHVSAMLNDLLATWHIPIFFRTPFPLPARPEDASWIAQADEIMSAAPIGVWARTADQLDGLVQRFPQEAWLWCQLASMRCWLGQHDTAAEAYRQLAGLKHISTEMAVEAETMAQLLNGSHADETSVANVVYDVSDTDQLTEYLLSDQRAVQIPLQNPAETAGDEPPPKAIFDILDRPQQRTLDDEAAEGVPNVIGALLIFGKQTDRNARAEWSFPVTQSVDEHKSQITQYLGDRLGAELSSETESTLAVSAIDRIARPRFPSEGAPDDLEKLRHHYYNQRILEEWPQLAMRALDGNPPEEAAKKPPLRRALLATVMRLEFSREVLMRNIDIGRLRSKLGLPKPELIDPWKDNVESLPVWQLHRLDSVKLSDEQLNQAFRRALLYMEVRALRILGLEALARADMRETFPEPFVCGVLARSSTSNRESLDYLHRAQRTSVEIGQSPAMYMIAELAHRLQRNEVDEFSKVLNEIRLRYLDQPGVEEKLRETLVGLGVHFAPAGAESGEAARPVAETVPPETDPTGIWTPDRKPSAEGDKPGIWLPGND